MSELMQKAEAIRKGFLDLDIETYASSITCYSFISLVPLLAICISLVSLVGIEEQEVMTFFLALVPDTFAGFVSMLIEDAFENSSLAFSLSTLSLMWSASMGIKALRRGLNVAYGVEESRGTVMVAVISLIAVEVLGLLLAALMYLIFRSSVLRLLLSFVPNLDPAYRNMLLGAGRTVVLAILSIAACYTFLPSGMRRYRDQLPGALCTTLACAVLSYAFHLYVDALGGANVVYGSIATVVLFLYWMYFVATIFVAGGYVNRVWADHLRASAADD